MKLIAPLLLSFFVLSCSGGNFNHSSDTSKGSGQNTQDAHDESPSIENSTISNQPATGATNTDYSAKPITSDGSSTTLGGYSMQPGAAVLPVAVGGASLTCLPNASLGMLCNENEGLDFAPQKAYYATDMEKIWLPTTFAKIDGLGYAVALPADLKSSPLNIAVMLLNAENQYIADMTFPRANNIINLVQDPGFENFPINPAQVSSGMRTLVSADKHTAWQGTRTAANASCDTFIMYEAASDYAAYPAAEGSRFLELSSPCDTSNVIRMPLVLSQTIKATVGHLYRVSYAYRKPAAVEEIVSLYVKLGLDDQSMRTVDQNQWTYASFVTKASTNELALSFEAYGTGSNRGTQLDHVMLVDLTALELGK